MFSLVNLFNTTVNTTGLFESSSSTGSSTPENKIDAGSIILLFVVGGLTGALAVCCLYNCVRNCCSRTRSSYKPTASTNVSNEALLKSSTVEQELSPTLMV